MASRLQTKTCSESQKRQMTEILSLTFFTDEWEGRRARLVVPLSPMAVVVYHLSTFLSFIYCRLCYPVFKVDLFLAYPSKKPQFLIFHQPNPNSLRCIHVLKYELIFFSRVQAGQICLILAAKR